MKTILKSSFWQLTTVYAIAVILISINLIWKYSYHFEVFALILAALSLFIIKNQDIKISKLWIILPILFILLIRIIPFVTNNIPLGYDPGIYKYAFESNRTDEWMLSTFPPGIYTFIDTLYSIGLTTDQILIPFFIFMGLVLGLVIYITTKKFFNEDTAVLSMILYSVSIIQFKVFTYFYFKNMLALIFLLLSFYLLKSNKRVLFILTAAFLGGIHRPTFLLFALIYVGYTILHCKDWKKNVLSGTAIIILTFPFYIGHFKELILQSITPLITANIGAGTFINLLTYQFSTLIYLPFALIGFLHLIKNRRFNALFLWFVINGIIVYFKIIFYDRFLIHMDIVMLILAGYGLYTIMQSKKKLGIAITVLLIASALYISLNESIRTRPLIGNEELGIIKALNNTEENSYVMATSSYYSPWVLGYSGRRTIAPGLFDYNKWNYGQWVEFWTGSNSTEELLSVYGKPLYIFVGRIQKMDIFNNSCFNLTKNINGTRIYGYMC